MSPCIKTYWVLKLIKRTPTEYIYSARYYFQWIILLLALCPYHITALYRVVFYRWQNSNTKRLSNLFWVTHHAIPGRVISLLPNLNHYTGVPPLVTPAHNEAHWVTINLSWVWILLCRAEFIHSPPWSSCITVRHIHKGQMGFLVRSSFLVSQTSTLLTAIEAFQIQIFERRSLKKMHFPNPIIHALNDNNNIWKKQHFEFKIISTH